MYTLLSRGRAKKFPQHVQTYRMVIVQFVARNTDQRHMCILTLTLCDMWHWQMALQMSILNVTVWHSKHFHFMNQQQAKNPFSRVWKKFYNLFHSVSACPMHQKGTQVHMVLFPLHANKEVDALLKSILSIY